MFNRPSGTNVRICLSYPAINRWAILNCPFGTKSACPSGESSYDERHQGSDLALVWAYSSPNCWSSFRPSTGMRK